MLRCVFVLLFLPVLLCAQEWKRVESGVTAHLNDVFFVNKDVGWAVGNDSTIIKSDDGGKTWVRQESGTSAHYQAVWFNDELHGWVVGGWNGVVVHTTDGGATWERQSCATTTMLQDVQFTSDSIGWIVGGGTFEGGIFKTTNAGKDWVEVGDTLPGVFYGLSFISNDEGWTGGAISMFDNFEEELIHHTTDGGATWELQWSDERSGPLFDIHFIDKNYGIATGQGPLMVTTNGGTVWQTRQNMKDVYSSYMVDTLHIYSVLASPPEFFLRHSGDLGRNWIDDSVQEMASLWGMYFVDTTHGWAVGNNGKIWVYENNPVIIDQPGSAGTTEQYRIFPNPVGYMEGNAVCFVAANVRRYGGSASFSLWNALGKHIDASRYTVTQSPEGWTLDVSRLNNGVYFIRVNEGGAVGKLVVCNK